MEELQTEIQYLKTDISFQDQKSELQLLKA